MRTERDSAIRLLQLLMVASLVFPAALFAYASYNDYHDVYAVADERIDRSLDVLQEQALKVFETVDRIFPEVGEVVRGMSDDQIRAAQASLTPRLQRIVGVMPQVQAITLIGARRPPAGVQRARGVRRAAPISPAGLTSRRSKTATPEPMSATCAPRRGRPPGTALFDVSRRLPSADGSFRGVIAVAVRPRYFDDFYAMIEQSPGNFYALVRPDGRLLARYPSGPQLTHQLSPQSALRQAIGRGLTHGLYLGRFGSRRP